MIFYTDKVPLSGPEMAFFEKIAKDPSFPVLPKWWRTGDTLRFAHTVKLDIEKTKIVTSDLTPVDRRVLAFHRGD